MFMHQEGIPVTDDIHNINIVLGCLKVRKQESKSVDFIRKIKNTSSPNIIKFTESIGWQIFN